MIDPTQCVASIENTEENHITAKIRLGSKAKHDVSSRMGERGERERQRKRERESTNRADLVG